MINKNNNKHSFTKFSPPPPKRQIPPPKIVFPQSKINNKPSLGNTLMEGMAFGTGSSIARNTIDNIFKNNSSNIDESFRKKPKCDEFFKELQLCLEKQSTSCDYEYLIEEYNRKCLESKNI